jgi:hypothetical protein
MKPLTVIFALFLVMVCIALIAAIVCHGNQRCKESFDAPKQLLLAGCSCVVLVALVMLEIQSSRASDV